MRTSTALEAFRGALGEWVAVSGRRVETTTQVAINNKERPRKLLMPSRKAAAGTKLIAVCDDAYYGMFFDDACETESLFGFARIATAAIKVDGATKEEFVWGLRLVLCLWYQGGSEEMYKALEAKTGGAIRGRW